MPPIQTIASTPSSLAFDEVIRGDSAALQVTLSSTGGDLDAVALSISPAGQFTVSPAQTTVTEAGVQVTVTFRPTTVGAHQAVLSAIRGGVRKDIDMAGAGTGIDVPADGSHLLIMVPDYGDTTFVNVGTDGVVEEGLDASAVDATKLKSYLRLGTFDFDTESLPAQELLRLIPSAGPAKFPKLDTDAEPYPEVDVSGMDTSGVVFNDDVRTRAQDSRQLSTATSAGFDPSPPDPDHGLSAAQRRVESARLYARGGWRDHSDGNRISTTWGDKVEVVRGNYKMIVLGRQNNPAQAMGWEASGGHIQDYAPGTMPGASFWLEWINDPRFYATGDGGDGRKGAWLLVNTTENVYQYARTAGNLRNENWGDIHEDYIGSETPPAGHATFSTADADGTGGHGIADDRKLGGLNYMPITPSNDRDQMGKVRSNPHIIEKTWARRIDSHTGSKACPVPDIQERTWADKIDGRTGASDYRVGEILDETWANKTSELVDVTGMIESNTRAGNIFEATTAGTIWGATTAAMSTSLDTIGVHTEVHLGGLHMEAEVGIAHITLELGMKYDFQIAGGFEVKTGPYKELTVDEFKVRLNEAKTSVQNVGVYLSCMRTIVSLEMMTLKTKIAGMCNFGGP